jgi:hypothetical protein
LPFLIYRPLDQYILPRKDFKLIACSIQYLWCSKIELTNPDTATAAAAVAVAVASSSEQQQQQQQQQ